LIYTLNKIAQVIDKHGISPAFVIEEEDDSAIS
jgi:hypothetical protein